MVHADFKPDNVLVRDGAVVAVVDIGNAGSGTRATDLTTLQWHTFQDPLDGVRRRLWTRILDLIDWEGAAVLTANTADLTTVFFQTTSDGSGGIDFPITFPINFPQTYAFSANDERPDEHDLTGTLWSNTVTLTAT